MPSLIPEAARLTAICQYLSTLKNLQLVSPSIGLPYPRESNEEKMIIHRSLLAVQNLRLRDINTRISLLKEEHNISYVDITNCQVFIDLSRKLRNKVEYLKKKFLPTRTPTVVNIDSRRNKNRKARERYKMRKFRRYFRSAADAVINLSNTTLTSSQRMLLALGSGFIPSSTNRTKEEEILILEGLRVLSRIGNVDSLLTNSNDQDNTAIADNPTTMDDTNTANSSDQTNAAFATNEFERSKKVPYGLKISQPKDKPLSHSATKLMKKEFENENQKLINLVRSEKKFDDNNLPKKLRTALKELKVLTKEKKIDIRKVDKGNTILVIDFDERTKIEEMNISKISKLCSNQKSNWEENRKFVENKMVDLFNKKFIDRNELTAVTGVLPGGVSGKLTKRDGTRKDTHAIDYNEYFAKQLTPYVYPLLKAHKLKLEDLKKVKPEEVSTKVPARLVVGMSSCQMSRVQAWLEAFLSPLSQMYGSFEYTKDSNDILIDFLNINHTAENESWDFSDITLFGIDVQALYPSVKFQYLKLALNDCFDKCTNWSPCVKSILIDLIMYTLENQQIFWNKKYYILDKGIPTGGKHCVPLANILLTYILLDLLRTNAEFRTQFESKVKLWKRYIDDCGGVFLGSKDFQQFFNTLEQHFNKFELQLTYEKSSEKLQLLDIEIFIDNQQFHTREHRKETASDSYVKFGSAHPKHCFKGIIKSQMFRLRRLCSRDSDFKNAVSKLRARCINSGYDEVVVDSILSQADTLERVLTPRESTEPDSDVYKVRWVILSGTSYEKQIQQFTGRLNGSLKNHNIKLELVKSTGSCIGQLLFNNNEKPAVSRECNSSNCSICSLNLRPDSNEVISPTTGRKYHIDPNLNCENCGIYKISCPCLGLYTGKTTTYFGNRFNEHFDSSRSSSVFEHSKSCLVGKHKDQYSIQFLENVYVRGKYTLSEREYLWNERLRGIINIHKTLKG